MFKSVIYGAKSAGYYLTTLIRELGLLLHGLVGYHSHTEK